MAAYVVVDIEVQDAARYEEYKRLAAPSVTVHGGRYIARGGATESLEGGWVPRRLVILEFPSAAQARGWWDSEEYREARAIRQSCARTQMIVTEGM